MMERNAAASLLTAFCILIGCGCVSQKIEPEYIPRVATARNSKGMVTISWPSRAGYNYRLVARDQGQVIVDQKVYKGTGEVIEIEFMLDPSVTLPDYSVMPEKVSGR